MENNKKTSRLLIFLTAFLIAIFFVGCDSILGTSTTDQADVNEIVYAEKVQSVFWACLEDENAKTNSYQAFVLKYGKDATDQGIQLYDAVMIKTASEISKVNISELSPELREEIIKLTQKIINDSKKEIK